MVVVMLLFGAKGQLSTVSGVYKVVDITSFGPVIKVSGTKVLVNTYDDFYLGNYIEISGSLKAPEISSNGFNLPEYLLSLNIKSIYKGEVKLFNDGRDIRMFLSKFLNNGRELYKKYAPLLLIGEKGNESKEVYKIALEMNVVHLFVISGFHLSLLNKLTNKIFKVIKIKDKTGEAISLVVVLFYIYLLNSSISSLRAFLLLLFNYINKYYFKKKYSGLNVLNSVTITMMVIAPWSITSLSFIYTFIATYVVIFMNSFKYKTELRKWTFVCIAAYLSTILISMLSNKHFSIFSLFFGIGLSPVFIVFYVLTLVLFPFKDLLNYMYLAFDFILHSFNQVNIRLPINFLSNEIVYYIYLISVSSIIITKKWNTYTDKKT